MASCDWAKIKGGTEAKAMFRHCEAEERLTANHTNKDIDKSRTHLNMNFGLFGKGYADICKAYDEHIEALDSVPGANKRHDRVTCIGWSIPAPEGLSDSDTQDWFTHAYGVLHDMYGDTVLGGTVHMDEVHEYTDPETHEKRMSRPAMHVYAVPEVGGKLNAKAFCSRANMVATNNAIEAMTNARYPGMKWQTGTKKKSRKTVEELKQASDAAAVIADAQEQASQIIAEAERTRESANAVLSDAKAQAREITEKAAKTSLRASVRLSEVQEMHVELSQKMEALKGIPTDRDSPEIEYMKKYKIRRPDGTKESVYDGYMRAVQKTNEKIAQQQRERQARINSLMEMGEEMDRKLQEKYKGNNSINFDF